MDDPDVPKTLWPHDTPAPKLRHVLVQIKTFLGELGYTKAVASLEKDAAKKGLPSPLDVDGETSLMDCYRAEGTAHASDSSSSDGESSSSSDDESDDASVGAEAEGELVDVEAEETSDDGSVGKMGQKRKRVTTPSSSSDDGSDSSSDSSSSAGDAGNDSGSSLRARPAKRTKFELVSSPSSTSGSESSGSADSNSSSSGSDSDSGSGLTSSDDDSESSSSSDSEPEPAPQVKPKRDRKEPHSKMGKREMLVQPAQAQTGRKEAKKDGSQSSATLEADSTAETAADSEENSKMHPDRLKRLPQQQELVGASSSDGKKKQVPFSRIPANQYVDPRFASNEYVSYDYADRAYQDLVVTKGKGFTKEKNKKKRGTNEALDQASAPTLGVLRAVHEADIIHRRVPWRSH